MKILLFKTGAIGDTLMTTPLVRQLRQSYPKARIDYLIGKSASQALLNNPNINNIIKFDEAIFFKKKPLKLINLIAGIREDNYDAIFVLDRHWIFNLTARLFNIPMRIGFDRNGKEGCGLTHKIHYERRRHDIYYYLNQLNALNIEPNYYDTKLDLILTKEDKNFANKFFRTHKLTKNTIGICPGGGDNPGQTLNAKIWDIKNYAELVKKIKQPILLLGGPNDKDKEETILTGKTLNSVIGTTTIHQSAALMAKCDKIICNDSGPMHMASTVNDKVIALFGPTDPKRLGPLNKGSKVIWKQNAPSYNNRGKYFGNGKELNRIRVDDVLRELK
jgi:lipopolysaccharide heptosyltransferase II